MPLVPQSTYEAWYAKTSWVYQAYRYLYINPLWTTRMPNGASLCPLFWKAILSLVVLRPLVYLTLGARWVTGLLRIGSLIRWTDSLALRVMGADGRSVFVLPTLFAAIVLSAAGGLLCLLGSLVYGAAVERQALTCSAFWVYLVASLVCLIHWEHTKGDRNRCRTEVYLHVLAAVLVALLAVTHTAALLQGALDLLSIPVTVAGWVWSGICWTVSLLWSSLAWLIGGAVAGFPYALITMAVLVGLAVVGYVLSRYAGLDLPGNAAPLVQLTKSEILINRMRVANALYTHGDPWSGSHCLDLIDAYLPAYLFVRERVLTDGDTVPTTLLDELVAFGRRQAEEADAKAARRSATCKRVTEALLRLCKPVTAVWRQLRIGGSYAWALVKAKKGGFCPYLHFKD